MEIESEKGLRKSSLLFDHGNAYWIICECGTNVPPKDLFSHEQLMNEASKFVGSNKLKPLLTYAVSRIICHSCGDEKNNLVLKSLPEEKLDFQMAIKAFENKNYDVAFEIFSNLKECCNHPNSLAMLGLMYTEGFGINKSYDMAIRLYESAKMQGIDCHVELGFLYEWGLGTEVDFLEAKENYELGHQLGNPKACYNLGTLYEHGRGVSEDIKKAIELYMEAAQKGEAAAFYNLGTLYLLGEKIELDSEVGISFLEMSADNGFAPATRKLGFIYFEGHLVPIDFQKAFHWFQMSILHGAQDGQKHCEMVKKEARRRGLDINIDEII